MPFIPGLLTGTQPNVYLPPPPEVEYLVVGGGAGGGRGDNVNAYSGGGGGAGGYAAGTKAIIAGVLYQVTTGRGGGGALVTTGRGVWGYGSAALNVTVLGGGGGGSCNNGTISGVVSGGQGGSGGGASYQGSPGSGVPNTGNSGGTVNGNGGGGGGGSGAAGGNAPNDSTGGVGGTGTSNSITGTAIIYAAGGGGGALTAGGAGGSSGAGGSGGTNNGAGSNATTPGSGGGGGANNVGGAGADGTVIIKHSVEYAIAATTGATCAITGGVVTYTFQVGFGTIKWGAGVVRLPQIISSPPDNIRLSGTLYAPGPEAPDRHCVFQVSMLLGNSSAWPTVTLNGVPATRVSQGFVNTTSWGWPYGPATALYIAHTPVGREPMPYTMSDVGNGGAFCNTWLYGISRVTPYSVAGTGALPGSSVSVSLNTQTNGIVLGVGSAVFSMPGAWSGLTEQNPTMYPLGGYATEVAAETPRAITWSAANGTYPLSACTASWI